MSDYTAKMMKAVRKVIILPTILENASISDVLEQATNKVSHKANG
jgi:hypothetical protein